MAISQATSQHSRQIGGKSVDWMRAAAVMSLFVKSLPLYSGSVVHLLLARFELPLRFDLPPDLTGDLGYVVKANTVVCSMVSPYQALIAASRLPR